MSIEKIISEKTKLILILSFVKGVGRVSLLKVIDSILSNPDLPVDAVLKGQSIDHKVLEDATAKANIQCVTALNLGHNIISPLDYIYSERLRVNPDRPPILYCCGDLSLLSSKNACVIGTREPTFHGVEIAARVTKWLSLSGWTIVSGLAKGIDRVAHDSSMSNFGKTISVMATGLDKVYPAAHKELANDIIKTGGLWISEYGYNSYVGKSNFVQRDRIQAAISDAVFLIQSGLNGGSLYASKAILEYQRPLIVVGQSMSDIMNRSDKALANIEILKHGIEAARKILSLNHFDENLLIKLNDKTEYRNVENFILNKVHFQNVVSDKQFDLI